MKMFSLQNISPEDFNYLLKYCKRSNKILGVECKELIHLPYWFVKVDIPNMINEGDLLQMIGKLLKENNKYFSERKLKRAKFQDIIAFSFWVRDGMEKIYSLEQNYLSSTPDADLMNAGIQDLNELGENNVIDILAGGDILKWEECKKLPYETVFDKLRKNKLESYIQKRLKKIHEQQQKRRR